MSQQAKVLAGEVVAQLIDEARSRRNDTTERHPKVEQSTAPRPQIWLWFVVALIGLGLVLAIMVGAVMAMRLADKIASIDSGQRERLAQIELRLTNAENEQIRLKTEQETREKDSAAKIKDYGTRLTKLEDRQTALVIYLVSSTDALLKDRGIKPPPVPLILQIAKGEAEGAQLGLGSRP